MEIIKQIKQELIENVDEKTKASTGHFFKESVRAYGVKIPVVNQIAQKYLTEIKTNGAEKAQMFELCDELWRSGVLEEALVACAFSESQARNYVPEDFVVFESWIKKYVSNWATCDTLCNHTVGDLLMMYPELAQKLIGWAGSDNRWLKRASAVSLIVPTRKGMFLEEVFRIVDILLTDEDDLVQKGYGWMLKAASMSEPAAKGDQKIKKQHTKAVFDYLMKNKAKMPRTALRYAIEKMPAELREQVMAK